MRSPTVKATRIQKLVGATLLSVLVLVIFVLSVTPTQMNFENRQFPLISTVNQLPMPRDYWLRIQRKDEKDAQMTYEQYSVLSVTLLSYSPMNALIFGVGGDSFIYFWA